MGVNFPTSDLSIGVAVPASIDLCRRILTGVRSSCESHKLRMHLLSDSSGLVSLKDRDLSKIPPLAGVVTHICSPEEFAGMRQYSPHIVGTSNRGESVMQPRVINDDAAIGRMGAEYLLSLGLRRLVVLNKRSMRYSRERRDAFLEIARQPGVEVECIDFSRTKDLEQIAASLLEYPPPIGLMAESDYTARSIIERIPDYRKVIPHRIAVLGVDDDSLQNALSPVSLSSVRTGGHEIGVRASELVMHLNAGGSVPEEALRIRPIRIVERASTSVLAVDDPMVIRAMRLLRDRVGDIRDVSDLVKVLGVNRRTLEIRFRAALNRSIAAELTQARLRNARHLLESTDLTVSEIADLVGYSEYRNLTLAFQRLTGEPPTAYRKRVRGG